MILKLRRSAFVVAGDSGNSIFSIVIQTFKSWLTGDRVRVATSHGRSLSIQPGDRIFIEGRNFLVQTRALTEDADPQNIRLVYKLVDQESNQTTTLEVGMRKDGTGTPQAVLKNGQQVSAICDADITIL